MDNKNKNIVRKYYFEFSYTFPFYYLIPFTLMYLLIKLIDYIVLGY